MNPCRNCGRQPKQKTMWVYDRYSRITIWWECRRWFGLRFCNRSTPHTNEKGWSDIAYREAAKNWNSENL